MKKHILLLLTAALLLTGCQKAEPKATETLPPAAETTASTAAILPVPEETKTEAPDFSFGDLKEWEFLFSSGAGSWGTQVRIGEDGSFSGEFYDNDNETGEGYYGVHYWCNFTGTFTQPQWISPYACSLTVETLEFEAEPGTEELQDGQKYVADEPRGLGLGEEFLLYLPGAPTEAMPEDILDWIHTWNPPVDGVLTAYALGNTSQEIGFAGYNFYEEERKALEDVENKASAMEEKLMTDGTLSQGDMNCLAGEVYQLWDGELNRLWRVLKETLDESTMTALTKEQLQWIHDKEAAVAAAGAEAEGGSLQPLLEATCAARLTKERVYYLMENFFQ